MAAGPGDEGLSLYAYSVLDGTLMEFIAWFIGGAFFFSIYLPGNYGPGRARGLRLGQRDMNLSTRHGIHCKAVIEESELNHETNAR